MLESQLVLIVTILIISLAFSLLIAPVIISLLKKGFPGINYKKKEIPWGLGLIITVLSLFTAPLFLIFNITDPFPLLLKLFLLFGVALAGIVDDYMGDSNRGFKAHIVKLLKGRELTSGMLKLITGGMLGITLGLIVENNVFSIILNALIFALSINTFNLLDVRPGRSLKLYIFLALLLFLWAENWLIFLLTPLLGAAVALLYFDLKEVGMLGDTGSNMLGASIGFSLVYILDDLTKLLLIVLLVAVQWAGDKISFTKIIEKNRLLKTIDDLGRKKD